MAPERNFHHTWLLAAFVIVQWMSMTNSNAAPIQEINLNGMWQVVNANKSISIKGSVPGSVHTALMENSVIKDPYYRLNDVDYRWIANDNWTYTTDFTVSKDILSKQRVVLVCHGLDTVASISINGAVVGDSSNMFIRYVFDIKEHLKSGANTITIAFQSAPSYANQKSTSHQYQVPPECPPAVQHGICHPNFIRKEQCSFSWDWGPAFAPQGIWKNISIEAYNTAVIRDVMVHTFMTKDGIAGPWGINVTVFFDPTNQAEGTLTVEIPELNIKSHMNLTLSSKSSHVSMLVKHLQSIKAWWPNGYGEQRLYAVNVAFENQTLGEKCSRKLKIGFREVKLVQETIKGSTGLSFYFKINNRPIFLKGSNWIPADAFQERIDKSRLKNLLQSTVDANMHALRVWGGGVYEQDILYEICDELGILIWQDFMFGCAMYPTDDAFLKSVQLEAAQQIRRLSSHPSILIWAGNNENEGALQQDWYGTNVSYSLYRDDYVKLYIDTIREQVLLHDPNERRPFVSSSPSNGLETEKEDWVAWNPQDTHYGDVHYYNYGADCWDVSTFPKPRFASEYGYQSWASFETLAKVSEKSDWSYSSNFSEHRQHHLLGNQEMTALAQKHFNLPSSTDPLQMYKDTLYLTQISQAMCIKSETEHYRRLQSTIVDGEGHTMGALYWQLNDIWQAPTWASIEYGGKWKMLHYYAKNFFAPVLASGMVQDKQLYVYVITDVQDLQNCKLRINIHKWDTLDKPMDTITTQQFNQSHQSAIVQYKNSLDDLIKLSGCSDKTKDCFLTFEVLSSTSEVISPVNSLFLYSFNEASGLAKPRFMAKVAQKSPNVFTIHLTTDHVTPFTWLETPGIRGRFSDNGFVMVESAVIVVFYAWESTTTTDIQNAITVTSLMNIYE
ncbi:beta-mannosidase-like [Amphiura filiformis]|uniref:beta-mannosidase-like n=1 Tax=Amphiura filiformis TaxID=82378 RepID=UPI003B20E5A7